MNKVYLLALVTLVGLSAFAITNLSNETSLRTNLVSSTQTLCPQPIFRSDAWMKKFLNELQSQSNNSSMMSYLEQQIPTDSHVFSTAQIISIFNVIPYDDSRLKALTLLNPYILTLSSQNIVDILGQMAFSSNKINSLRLIANTLSDVSDQTKQSIISSFTFSSDKSKAAEILNALAPRNCIYGSITEKVASFVIDVSGSMDYTFYANGENITRLSFIQSQLTKTLADQLKSYQKFNIIIFSSSASQWKSEYVDATPENVKAGIAYINSLTAYGGTNISSGLDLAFNTKQDLNTIYLLSDGVPNMGVQTIDGFKQYLANQNSNRSQKVRVNTISFIMGGVEPQSERSLSQEFLMVIADSTNGSFKGIQD